MAKTKVSLIFYREPSLSLEHSPGNLAYSVEACAAWPTSDVECFTLSKSKCIFPFKYGNKTFATCTSYDSVNSALWCPTRVRASNGEAVRGHLEDCLAPCVAPAEECPRNPVVRESRGCCTEEAPCRVGEGGCTSHLQCQGDFKCGDSNCANFRPDNARHMNCCFDPLEDAQLGLPPAKPLFYLNENEQIECAFRKDCPEDGTDFAERTFTSYSCIANKCMETKQSICASPLYPSSDPECLQETDGNSTDLEVFSGTKVALTTSLAVTGVLSTKRPSSACPNSRQCHSRRGPWCCRPLGLTSGQGLVCPFTCPRGA